MAAASTTCFFIPDADTPLAGVNVIVEHASRLQRGGYSPERMCTALFSARQSIPVEMTAETGGFA